jgi:hypothetical protein
VVQLGKESSSGTGPSLSPDWYQLQMM